MTGIMAKHIDQPNRIDPNYRIIKHVSYDEWGKERSVWYTVEEYVKGLFGSKWKTLAKQYAVYDGMETRAIEFKTRDAAAEYIERLVDRGDKVNCTESFEVP